MIITIYDVNFGKGMNRLITQNALEVYEILQDLDEGDTVTVSKKAMDDKDYNSLPEFDGP